MNPLLRMLVLLALATAATAQRPNVLLILADDLGYSDLGSFGGEIPTPNLDRLARGGVRFTQCYNSARCCPSRASLMTGLYPHQTGIGSFATRQRSDRRGPAYIGRLNDQCVTIAEVLRPAGYQTYMVGKWHMEKPGPMARGFDEFYGFIRGYEQDQWQPKRYVRLPRGRKPRAYAKDGFYATDVFTDYALDFLSEARKPSKKGRPWFLYLAHSAPHFPVQAPQKSVAKFVATYRRGWDVLRAERFARMRISGLALKGFELGERETVPVDGVRIANGYPGLGNPAWDSLSENRREDLARRMAVFAAMVHHIDIGVGRVLADLEKHGELDNTIIIFLSDNGACYEWGPFGFDGPSRKGVTKLHTGDELSKMGGPGSYHSYGSAWANLGNTPLRMYKHFTHEGGICTPMIAHWPKGIARPDRFVRDPVHIMDVMPTLCEVAEATYPKRRGEAKVHAMEGVSLVKSFRGEALPERSLAFEHQGARALRRGPWKIVWSKRQPTPVKWELYNLASDRCEQHDLAAEHTERTARMAAAWEGWARRVKVFPFFRPEKAPRKQGK